MPYEWKYVKQPNMCKNFNSFSSLANQKRAAVFRWLLNILFLELIKFISHPKFNHSKDTQISTRITLTTAATTSSREPWVGLTIRTTSWKRIATSFHPAVFWPPRVGDRRPTYTSAWVGYLWWGKTVWAEIKAALWSITRSSGSGLLRREMTQGSSFPFLNPSRVIEFQMIMSYLACRRA